MKHRIIVIVLILIIALFTIGCESINEEYDAADKLRETDFYKALSDDEKKEFDEELKKITGVGSYDLISDEGKEELIDRFFESQKVLHEIKNDKPDVDPETIVIPEDATEQEKAELEQEKAYWETVGTIKDKVLSGRRVLNGDYSTVRKVLAVYANDGQVGTSLLVKAEFVNRYSYAGFEFYSLTTEYLQIVPDWTFDQSFSHEELLDIIDSSIMTATESICSDINNPEHIEYFNQNKDFVCEGFSYWLDQGYQVSVYESWECESAEHPDFVLKLEKEGTKTLYTFSKYYLGDEKAQSAAKYSAGIYKRACEKFWNRLEGKEAAV